MNYPAMPKVKGFKSSILKFLELNYFLPYYDLKSLVALSGVENSKLRLHRLREYVSSGEDVSVNTS